MNYKYFVSSQEMKKYDAATIDGFGIPAAVLMERAALSIADEIEKRFPAGSRALVAAGCGNNGGDGIAAGRILRQHGYEVDFVLPVSRSECSAETDRQLHIIEKYGCLMQGKIEDKEYDIIIDALFGIGLSRAVEGAYASCIGKINELQGFVCAADIPSGINADTGAVMGAAVKADLTVTFAFEKRGLLLYPGCAYAGEVVCRDIGITQESFEEEPPEIYSYADSCKKKAGTLLPVRYGGGNKGTFGKVLSIAGSLNMSGACELCVKSAYRMGAGMVKAVTPEENREIIQRNIPEALLTTYRVKADEEVQDALIKKLQTDIRWADCIVIGPGLGKSGAARAMLSYVLRECEKPLVIDADGLNLLAETEELKRYMEKEGTAAKRRPVILTPHIAEFSRLANLSAEEVKRDIFHVCRELANRFGSVVVCKDARTVVAVPEKRQLFINTTGNDGMATAGSGDVLAGVIGALLAQGLEAEEAAYRGVYIHGIAGDLAAGEYGRHALMAGDLIRQLGCPAAKERTL